MNDRQRGPSFRTTQRDIATAAEDQALEQALGGQRWEDSAASQALRCSNCINTPQILHNSRKVFETPSAYRTLQTSCRMKRHSRGRPDTLGKNLVRGHRPQTQRSCQAKPNQSKELMKALVLSLLDENPLALHLSNKSPDWHKDALGYNKAAKRRHQPTFNFTAQELTRQADQIRRGPEFKLVYQPLMKAKAAAIDFAAFMLEKRNGLTICLYYLEAFCDKSLIFKLVESTTEDECTQRTKRCLTSILKKTLGKTLHIPKNLRYVCCNLTCSLLQQMQENKCLPHVEQRGRQAVEQRPDSTFRQICVSLFCELYDNVQNCTDWMVDDQLKQGMSFIHNCLNLDPKLRRVYFDNFLVRGDETNFWDMDSVPSIKELDTMQSRDGQDQQYPPMLSSHERSNLNPFEAMTAFLDRTCRLFRFDSMAEHANRTKPATFLERQTMGLVKMQHQAHQTEQRISPHPGMRVTIEVHISKKDSKLLHDPDSCRRIFCEQSLGMFQCGQHRFCGIIANVTHHGSNPKTTGEANGGVAANWYLDVQLVNSQENIQSAIQAFLDMSRVHLELPNHNDQQQSTASKTQSEETIMKEAYQGMKRLCTFRCISKGFNFAVEPFIRSLKRLPKTVDPESSLAGAIFGGKPPAARRRDYGNIFGLDTSQQEAFNLSLESELSLIQGPPGTGKTYVGAAIAASLIRQDKTVLVVCVTNHAVDQFVEYIIKAQGKLSESKFVRPLRIGGSTKHEAMKQISAFDLVNKHKKNTPRADQMSSWMKNKNQANDDLKIAEETIGQLMHSCTKLFPSVFSDSSDSSEAILQGCRLWELTNADCCKGWAQWLKKLGYDESQLPMKFQEKSDGGFQTVTETKKKRPKFWWSQWLNGTKNQCMGCAPGDLWEMSQRERVTVYSKWIQKVITKLSSKLHDLNLQVHQQRQEMEKSRRSMDAHILKCGYKANLVACTTNGAAKHLNLLHALSPDVLMVEEAGEVLETHVLTSMSRTISKMILIGDHKQLRPKVNKFDFSARSGKGIDFDISMFERLVKEDFPYQTLLNQHRMKKEISDIPRICTYNDLRDDPSTEHLSDRQIPGLADTMIFWDCKHSESSRLTKGSDIDDTIQASCANEEEAERAVALANHICQQRENVSLAILTPYLGQLRLIRSKATKYPALHSRLRTGDRDQEAINEEDANNPKDLEDNAAGLDAQTRAQLSPVKLSTIDNFQGEEADVVIASLVRSNHGHGRNQRPVIGFMDEAERVNVLFSRARFGFVAIGNYKCFVEGSHGKPASVFWHRLKDFGFRISTTVRTRCSRHPIESFGVSCAADFQRFCAHGGCSQPCTHVLPCQHQCSLVCHDSCRKRKQSEGKVVCKACKKAAENRKMMDRMKAESAKQREKIEYEIEELNMKKAQQEQRMLIIAEEIGLLEKEVTANEDLAKGQETEERIAKYRDDAKRARDELKNKQDAQKCMQELMDDDILERRKKLQSRLDQEIEKFEKQEQKLREEYENQLEQLRKEEAIAEARQRMNESRLKWKQEQQQKHLEDMRQCSPEVECNVCYGNFKQNEGIACCRDHFSCAECYSNHCKHDYAKFECNVSFDHPGEVVLKCLDVDCPETLDYEYVNANIDDDAKKCIRKRYKDHMTAIGARHTQEVLKAARMKWEQEGEIERCVNKIDQDILTLSCPRCSQAFIDFDGCLALKCNNGTCNAGFCAICLKDCGPDAHAHAASCEFPSEVRKRFPNVPNFGGIHAIFESWKQWQRYRKAFLLQEHLIKMDQTVRAKVIATLKSRKMLDGIPLQEDK